MKGLTPAAFTAFLGCKAVLAAPVAHEDPDDFEYSALNAASLTMLSRQGLCLEWNAEEGNSVWVNSEGADGHYIPTMDAKCNPMAWQMEQGPRLKREYTVMPVKGTPDSCSDWQVQVKDGQVAPICMDDLSEEIKDLRDDLPFHIDYAIGGYDVTSGAKQPSLDMANMTFQVGEPYKECDQWKMVTREWSVTNYSPTIGPTCWKWKDSENEVNNYTIVNGVTDNCMSPHGMITRLDGYTAYPQCANTPDVGFDKSITDFKSPKELNETYGSISTQEHALKSDKSTEGYTSVEWLNKVHQAADEKKNATLDRRPQTSSLTRRIPQANSQDKDMHTNPMSPWWPESEPEEESPEEPEESSRPTADPNEPTFPYSPEED